MGSDQERRREDADVELRFPPPVVPTPMSPSAPEDVPRPENEPALQSNPTFSHTSNGAGVEQSAAIMPLQQQVQRQARGSACQRRPPDGALQHFSGRNVLCLSGRCVLGPPSR